MSEPETITMFRPVGAEELALIEESGWREFPPRQHDQPVFYPVLNEQYATQIARNWNAKYGEPGFVTRFRVAAGFARHYPVQPVGSRLHQDFWAPAEDIQDFNDHIVGLIEVVAEFKA